MALQSFHVTTSIDARSSKIISTTPFGSNLDNFRVEVVATGDLGPWQWVTLDRIDYLGIHLSNTNTFSVTVSMTVYYKDSAYRSMSTGIVERSISLPDGFQDEVYYRLYAAHAGNALLTNLATPTVFTSGPYAGLTMRTGPYANVTMHLLTQDFVVFLPYLVTGFALAAALNPRMKCVPGARIWPSATATFDDCILNAAYIATKVDEFSILCDMALASGHNQIHIDCEQYSADPTLENSEPNNVWLDSKGVTEGQFRAAWQPFVDMLLEKGMTVSAGQVGKDWVSTDTRDNLQSLPLFFLDSLGIDRMECMSEASFTMPGANRTDPEGSAQQHIVRQHALESGEERAGRFKYLNWRPFIYDDELHAWGMNWPGSIAAAAFTPRSRAILYDVTRTNYASRGTIDHYSGKNFVGGTPNDCEYVVPFCPTATRLLPAFDSVGMSTKISMEVYAGTTGGSGGLTPSALSLVDNHGITLNAAPAPFDHTYLRLADALPNSASAPFSIDIDGFWIPSDVATDLVIMCIGQSNVLVCQVVYLLATDKIQVQWGSGGATTHDLLATPTKNAVHRLQLIRDNGTQYRVGINAVAMTTVATPATSIFRTIQLGAGRNPSSPSTALGWGAPGMKYRGAISEVVGGTTSYLVGQLAVSHRAWDATDIVNVRAGHYPWGYGS